MRAGKRREPGSAGSDLESFPKAGPSRPQLVEHVGEMIDPRLGDHLPCPVADGAVIGLARIRVRRKRSAVASRVDGDGTMLTLMRKTIQTGFMTLKAASVRLYTIAMTKKTRRSRPSSGSRRRDSTTWAYPESIMSVSSPTPIHPSVTYVSM